MDQTTEPDKRTVCICQTILLTHLFVLPAGCDPSSERGRLLVDEEATRLFSLHLDAVRNLPGDFEWCGYTVQDADTDEELWDVDVD